MLKTTNQSYNDFEIRLLTLVRLVEGARKYIYTDSKTIATIGIGFNIEVIEWRKVILMYKCGILTPSMLETQTNLNTEPQVKRYINSLLTHASQSMQTLINTASQEIKNKIDEYKRDNNLQANSSQESPRRNVVIIQNLQNDINTILQNNIAIYNNNAENRNNQLVKHKQSIRKNLSLCFQFIIKAQQDLLN
ncbi:hypothetical protein [Helicobacter monodelphidis]|uniref:hypothetical protein n=1 Tax=Helicobacter sp. 15-1451 TaxID=2004995 RepID=UPI0015EC040C|nr:hypothetical protein [Helicobacter sp. 15-1451]